jgi:hypothetical protein
LEIAVAGRHNCLLSRLSWLSVKQWWQKEF